MSDELVEAVARALWEAQCDHWMHYRGQISELCNYDQLGPSKQGEVAREARAAIAVVIERVVRELDKCGEPCPVCHDAIRKLGESE